MGHLKQKEQTQNIVVMLANKNIIEKIKVLQIIVYQKLGKLISVTV